MTGRTSAALKKAISLLSKYSVSEAARKAGVSRSTIYRSKLYKDILAAKEYK